MLGDEDNKDTVKGLPALTEEQARAVIRIATPTPSDRASVPTVMSSQRPVLNPPTMPPSDPAGEVEAVTARDTPRIAPWLVAVLVLAIAGAIALLVMR
jgi:hypothetical protein